MPHLRMPEAVAYRNTASTLKKVTGGERHVQQCA
jgi:hypothetical protein